MKFMKHVSGFWLEQRGGEMCTTIFLSLLLPRVDLNIKQAEWSGKSSVHSFQHVKEKNCGK